MFRTKMPRVPSRKKKKKKKKKKRLEEEEEDNNNNEKSEGPKDETVAKLGRMCKAAGITKATHVFMKQNERRETEGVGRAFAGERGSRYSFERRTWLSQGEHRTREGLGRYRRVEYNRRRKT